MSATPGVFIWAWPIVAVGQPLAALDFAEVSTQATGRHPVDRC